MSEDELPTDDADLVIEREGTYDHEQYGEVEVTGIWKGVDGVDTTREANEKDIYIVRYAAQEKGERVDELTDTLDEFIGAIE